MLQQVLSLVCELPEDGTNVPKYMGVMVYCTFVYVTYTLVWFFINEYLAKCIKLITSKNVRL